MDEWFDGFNEALRQIGICEGDIIYLSSDTTQLLLDSRRKFGFGRNDFDVFLDRVIEEFKQIIGFAGTLLVPVFTWEYCRTGKYDIKRTKSEVGTLGNFILSKKNEFIRTQHPIYSFMVWGKDAEKLAQMDNHDGWDEDSPFAYMRKNHAKSVMLNTPVVRSFTFSHYVEKNINVPYRYTKDFTGIYIEKNDCKSIRTYSMYVRDLGIESRQCTSDDCFDKYGITQYVEYDNNYIRVVDLTEAYDIVKDNYLYNGGNEWYKFSKYEINWNNGHTHEYEKVDLSILQEEV